jgi:diaminohydroxyphosphoribosylaminopyrimidine deaminase/5-amino-6-(5-phosphoribosylamino)uracil reductase
MAIDGAASDSDRAAMRAALALARRGLGMVWPNPAVGCVVVKDGRVVGRGWTQRGGRPHAEAEALARAGAAARGATVYTSLEPCSHWGRTPPCADALIGAGVGRVVAALEDPDPRVAGTGNARLRDAGIGVEVGLCAAEAGEVNAGFFCRLAHGRPLVTLKLAASLDGRIATATGESRWITGPAARERAHLLRATHDAVMIGTGTALADDPELTCRLPGLSGRSPVRIVLDGRLRLPDTMRAFAPPSWVLTLAGAPEERRARLRRLGAEVIGVPPDADGRIDLALALQALGARGLTRLLVEGGGTLAAALLARGLVDRLVWLHAPLLIGGDGIPAVAPLGLAALAGAPGFVPLSSERVGADRLEIYAKRAG